MSHNVEIKNLPDGRIVVYINKIKDKTMNEFFEVGDKLFGFCNGYFGRDSYDTKICVLVKEFYAVFLLLDGPYEGHANVLNDPSRLNVEEVKEWKIKYRN